MTKADHLGLTTHDYYVLDKYGPTFARAGWLSPNDVVNTVIETVGDVIIKQMHLVVTPQEVLDAVARVMTTHGSNCTICQHGEFVHDSQYGCIYLTEVSDPITGLPVKCGCGSK